MATNGVTTNGTPNGTPNHAKEDNSNLLPHLIPRLDRHLVFPVLEFLESQPPAHTTADDIKHLKYTLLKETNMADYVSNLYCELHNLEEPPQEQVQKRDEILDKRQQLEEQTAKLTNLLDDESVSGQLRSDKVANLNWLRENYQIMPEDIARLYEYGQYLYSLGDYGVASDVLFQFRILVS